MKQTDMWVRFSVCLLLTCLIAAASRAQSVLVNDICPGGCESSPTNLAVFGSTLYFSATNGSSGQELYKSNGTSAGTVLIKDIRSGANGSAPAQFTSSNSKVFFTANDGVHGEELWITDGTAAGTVLVKDIWPGSYTSSISNLVSVNNVLYFRANDGSHGSELWKSDGTTAGTVLLRDFKAGLADGGIQSIAGFQNQLFFSRTFYEADGYSVNAGQMWKFDPVTQKFSVLFTVPYNFIDDLTAHQGSLYYGVGNSGEYVSVVKMNADQKGGTAFAYTPGYYLGWIRSIGGKLLIAGADEWYPLVVDVKDISNPANDSSLGDGVQDVTSVAGNLYFTAFEYRDEESGVNRYTSIYKNIPYDNPLSTFSGDVWEIVTLGSKVIFPAYTSGNGTELRSIDVGNAREGLLAEEKSTLKLYPNPTSAQSTIEFSALETGSVGVDLFDMQGNKLQSVFAGEMNAGEARQRQLDASSFASGMYFVRMTNGKSNQYQKLTITK